MPAIDLHIRSAEDEHAESEPAEPRMPGTDPGEPENWEIVRVHCPACDRPIALVGDEERLPHHAVLPTAWSPFSASLCPGSGAPTEELAECEAEDGDGEELATLFALPAALDWRTQPFSHVAVDRAVRAPYVPAQRTAA